MVKISYITITFNAEATIPHTIESVLCQDYEAIEHIIVDGASRDRTLDIAEAYKRESDSRNNGHEVKIISEPDNGIYDAMNKGLALASGKYICFLNAGDSLPQKNIVSLLVKGIENKAEDALPAVLYGDTEIVDSNRYNLGKRRLSPPETLTWKSFKNGMLVCHQSFYARTDLAQQVKYDLSYRHSADFDWCIRLMRLAETNRIPFYNSRLTLTNYLKEGDTTMHHKDSLIERYNIMCKYYGKIPTILRHIWFAVRNISK